MPKIPDFQSLGPPSSLRSGRAVVSAGDLGAGAIGAGLQKLGRGLEQGTAAELKARDINDRVNFTAVDADTTRGLLELERSFDKDPNFLDYEARFDKEALKIVRQAQQRVGDPDLSEKFTAKTLLQVERSKGRVLNRAVALERQGAVVKVEDALRLHRDRYTSSISDDERSGALRDMEGVIALNEQGGLLEPSVAGKFRNDYVRGAVIDDAETQLDTDPESLLRDLGAGPAHAKPVLFNADGTPSTEQSITIESDGPDGQKRYVNVPTFVGGKRIKPEEAATLYREGSLQALGEFDTIEEAEETARKRSDKIGRALQGVSKSSGAASPQGLAFIRGQEGFTPTAQFDVRQYSNGYGTKARSPNETIDEAEAEKRLQAEAGKVSDWIAKNVKTSLTLRQHDALVSFGYNLGTDDLDKLKGDLNAGRFDRVAERMLSFNRADGQVQDVLTRRRQEEAEMFLGQRPSSRYALLSPELRAKYAKQARVNERSFLESRRSELKQQFADDVESVRRTGKGRQVEVDTARKVLEPNQVATYVLDRREAGLEHEASYGLPEMTEAQLDDHLESIAPKPGEANYAMKQKVFDKLWTKVNGDKGLRKLRETDPAESVTDFREVQAAASQANETDPASMVNLVRARLTAQERVGIGAADRRAVTKREARALASPLRGLEEGESFDVLRQVNDTIKKRYGDEYSGLVLRGVIEQTFKDKTERENFIAAMEDLERQGVVKPSTQRRMRERTELDEMQRNLVPPPPERSIGERFRSFIDRYTPQELQDAVRGAPAPAASPLKPPRGAIDALKRSPGRAQEFEKKYNLPPGGARQFLLSP